MTKKEGAMCPSNWRAQLVEARKDLRLTTNASLQPQILNLVTLRQPSNQASLEKGKQKDQ